jgi:hypothetical protein
LFLVLSSHHLCVICQINVLTSALLCLVTYLYSLLGLGYKLDQIISAAEETKRIRKSRQQNMKGKWENFRKVFEVAAGIGKLKVQPKIVAGKSA